MNHEEQGMSMHKENNAAERPPAEDRGRSMKFVRNNQYFNVALYGFLAVAAAMVFYELIKNFTAISALFARIVDILQPVMIGLVLAYILNPLLRLFDDKLLARLAGNRMRRKVRRGLAILLTYIVAVALVGGFVAIVLPQLIVSVRGVFLYVPDFVQTISELYSSALSWLGDFRLFEQQDAGTAAFTGGLIDKLLETTSSLLDGVYTWLYQLLPSVFIATQRITGVILNIVLGLIISIYLLFDRERFFAQAKKVMAAILPRKVNTVVMEIAQESHTIFQGFIVGKIIDSVIIGIICYVFMALLKFNFALLIAVIVGVTNVVPYFGPFIGAIPGILILYIVEPKQALWFLIFIFLLQQFDGNILGPKILGDSIGISAFWVVFSITLFSGIYGIPGMFIGVPMFALLYSLIKRFTAFLLRRKGESTSTRDYDSAVNPLLK